MNTKQEIISNIEYLARLVRRGMVHIEVFNSVVEEEINSMSQDMEDSITMEDIQIIKSNFGIN